MPVSQTHSAADELFCTRKPFIGTAPPNSVCGLPPVATVPLPSLAAAPAVLMTGSGFAGPTGLATPWLTEAGACTGTRLPLPSSSVDSDWMVVFASLTRSVMAPHSPVGHVPFGRGGDTPRKSPRPLSAEPAIR